MVKRKNKKAACEVIVDLRQRLFAAIATKTVSPQMLIEINDVLGAAHDEIRDLNEFVERHG